MGEEKIEKEGREEERSKEEERDMRGKKKRGME